MLCFRFLTIVSDTSTSSEIRSGSTLCIGNSGLQNKHEKGDWEASRIYVEYQSNDSLLLGVELFYPEKRVKTLYHVFDFVYVIWF